jgi:pimeloyl-ACP methyl ester carboxylesterase
LTADAPVRLAYQRLGDGEPLVLLHGLASSRRVWNPILGQLARRYHITVVDLPGHGESPALKPGLTASPQGIAHSIHHLLDTLRLTRVHLAGHSLGGWIALELAAAGRARSVTALAPAGFWSVPRRCRGGATNINRLLARATASKHETLTAHPLTRTFGFWSVSATPWRLATADAYAAAQAMAQTQGYDAAHNGVLHRRFDRSHAIDTDSTPVTIAWGDSDRILPRKSCQDHQLAPLGSRCVTLRHCGHVPMWDAPKQTIHLIGDTSG